METSLLAILVFVVAVLYSSVGHGGASGYLAVMALLSFPPQQMAPTALVLNVLVAGTAVLAFARAGHLFWRVSLPFLLTSVPLAFAGGMLRVSDRFYFILLAVALTAAALRLTLGLARTAQGEQIRTAPLWAALPLGGVIGLVSGMVGVGGGIFLSPLMILLRWATIKQTAATAALFILLNSLAGLGGRLLHGGLDVTPALPVVAAAFAGGVIGSYFGANRMSPLLLRRALALVLLLAAVKLVATAF